MKKNNNFLDIFLNNIYSMVQKNQRSYQTFKQYKRYLSSLKNWNNAKQLIVRMNRELANNKISNNTKLTKRNIFSSFLNWFCKITNTNMDVKNELLYIKEEKGKRQAIPEKELIKLVEELKSYKNTKFSIIFRIFLSTGIRVGEYKEFIKNIDKLEKENWSFIIKTLKNNNPRYFRIPSKLEMPLIGNLREDILENIDKLRISEKSIKNMFYLFKKHISEKYPDFKYKISAHVLRHNYATKAFYNLKNNDLVAKLLGHTNSNITQKTYIDYDKSIMDEYAILAIQDQKIGLNSMQLLNINNNLELTIIKLEKENCSLKEEIEMLKNKIKKLKK
ncbi:site-specific tyrosine recombinase XerC (plasmid) [Mesomycoplasma conjunctivae]|nr:site-specific integrase [Mycoplasmopsis fermentans]ADV34362.1 Int [Mycoplasmopsis fermentans M64]VEU64179.1 site-specific tyrosine recombinase XerC [Mycoplasmopsis fermentans]VEU67565.1 site-specific tyrosine recombinase XerC [Mesomycoplasma conjunctivae]